MPPVPHAAAVDSTFVGERRVSPIVPGVSLQTAGISRAEFAPSFKTKRERQTEGGREAGRHRQRVSKLPHTKS